MTEASQAHAFSSFALDVYVASGKAESPDLEAHLRTCGRCRAYVDELDALAKRPPPAWDDAPVRPLRSARSRYAWAGALAGALAVAAAAVLVLRTPPTLTDETYVGVKGTPAVQVLLRRQGRTQIWNGQESVRPGDALALRVGCEGFSHVTVATPGKARGSWTRLADEACPGDDAPLPFSLIVDDHPGEERLIVLLSEHVLDEGTLLDAAGQTSRTRGVWVVPFVFSKDGSGR